MGQAVPGGSTIVTALLVILALILLNGIFAGAEIAVVSVRRTRMAELSEEGHRAARAVQHLRRNPERFFATVQIGITVVGATAAALGGSRLAGDVAPLLQRAGLSASGAHAAALALVVGGISYLSLVLGELVPKSLGLRYAEGYALMVARPLLGLGRLTRPLVWLLTASSNLVLRFFGDETSFTEGRMSAEELQLLVEDAARSGSVDTRTSEIASRAFDLTDIQVDAVMVPRNRMDVLDRNASTEDIKRVVMESGRSRIPVKDGSVDDIVGYIVAKDLLTVIWRKGRLSLEEVLRPAYFIPETMKALDALREMQRRRLQLAIVVDERGAVAGLVTAEDLVEELVGEIVSEHERPGELARQMEDGRFLVTGTAPLRDVNRALDLELPEGEGFTTIAGLAISLAGRIPARGERFTAPDGTEIEVKDATSRRVKCVLLKKPERTEGEEEEETTRVRAGEQGAHV